MPLPDRTLALSPFRARLPINCKDGLRALLAWRLRARTSPTAWSLERQ
jgi:hypothetical protein